MYQPVVLYCNQIEVIDNNQVALSLINQRTFVLKSYRTIFCMQLWEGFFICFSFNTIINSSTSLSTNLSTKYSLVFGNQSVGIITKKQFKDIHFNDKFYHHIFHQYISDLERRRLYNETFFKRQLSSFFLVNSRHLNLCRKRFEHKIT